MNERTPISNDLDLLVHDVRGLNIKTGKLKDERRAVGRLDDASYLKLRSLQQEKNQKLIDIILLESERSRVSIDYYKFPTEAIHQFSMNGLSVIISDWNFGARAEFTDLRRPNLFNDSREVERFLKVLPNVSVLNDSPDKFLTRTFQELRKIDKEITRAREFGSDFVVEALGNLSSEIISQRFIEHGARLPRFRLKRDTVRLETGDFETFTIQTRMDEKVFLGKKSSDQFS